MSAEFTREDFRLAAPLAARYCDDVNGLAKGFAQLLADQRAEIVDKYEAVAVELVIKAGDFAGTVLTGTNAYLDAAYRIREVSR